MGIYEIATTTFNDALGIIPFLENICKQTVLPERIVIADGGSDDNTVCLIKEFQDKSIVPITIISCEERLNIPQGFNAAIMSTKADYIGIAAVGNLYNEQHFERLMECLEENDIDIAYPYLYGQNSTAFSNWYNVYFLNGNHGVLGRTPSNHGALLKRTVFEKSGYFLEELYVGEDTEFYRRALQKGIKAQPVKEARVYWETPKSFREYCKQLNNYTIGDMRVMGNWEIIWRKKKKILLCLIMLLIIMSGFITKSVLLTLGLMIGVILLCLLHFRNFGWIGSWYCIFNIFLTVFYLAKNCKYFCASRKVKAL